MQPPRKPDLKCLRCHHEWSMLRPPQEPKHCPLCMSTRWKTHTSFYPKLRNQRARARRKRIAELKRLTIKRTVKPILARKPRASRAKHGVERGTKPKQLPRPKQPLHTVSTSGISKTPEYRAWSSMKTRCFNQKHADYRLYGARGITVCARWRTSFFAFIADVGARPSALYSIDRINNNGNYEPGNCKWSTASEQQRNKRSRLEIESAVTN